MFTAAKAEGAYLNEKRIDVSTIDRLATSLLATGFPSAKRSHNPNIHYYWDFTLRSHGVRRDGSAALDLARGRLRALRWLLGVWVAFLGHCGWSSSGPRGRREGDRVFRPALSARVITRRWPRTAPFTTEIAPGILGE